MKTTTIIICVWLVAIAVGLASCVFIALQGHEAAAVLVAIPWSVKLLLIVQDGLNDVPL